MVRVKGVLVAIIAMLLACCASAPAIGAGQEYASSKGYTITFPEGWTIISKDVSRQAEQAQDLRMRKLDASLVRQADVLAFGSKYQHVVGQPHQFQILEHVFVEVVPARLAINDASARAMEKAVRKKYEEAGFQVQGEIEFQVESFGGYDALSGQWELTAHNLPTSMHIWQVVFCTGSRSIVVVGRCGSRDFGRVGPEFFQTINSIQIEQTFADRIYEVPKHVLFAIIGAVVVAGVGLLCWLVLRAGKPPEDNAAGPPPGQAK